MTRALRHLFGYLVGAAIMAFVLRDEFVDWRRRRRDRSIFGDGPF